MSLTLNLTRRACFLRKLETANLFHNCIFLILKKLGPSIIKSVVNMVLEIIANGSIERSVEDVLGKALGEILGKVNEM